MCGGAGIPKQVWVTGSGVRGRGRPGVSGGASRRRERESGRAPLPAQPPPPLTPRPRRHWEQARRPTARAQRTPLGLPPLQAGRAAM
ncbi:hypothetical protein MC885_009837 [Smutsia gigantea]|nr:hypothetical protein MC885_009837 [Smutsia gigantea]